MDLLIGQKKPQPPAPGIGAGGASGMAAAGAAPGMLGAGAPGTDDDIIVDGTEANFMQEVVEASRTRPVLVDFWATWCGPCKQLTPILEKVVRAAGGRVKLVKVDIDKNAGLVQQLMRLGLPLQSVPTVAAFSRGQVADVFQGALPESEIKRSVESLLKMSGGSMPAADLVAEAKVAMEEERHEDAASIYSTLLGEDGENPEAWGGLVRALLATGDEQAATEALSQVPEALVEHAEVSGARAALKLSAEGREAATQLARFEAAIAGDPDDHQARYDLATALNALGRREEAAAALLEIVKRDRSWMEDGARAQLLKFFEAWGLSDPSTLAARRKLSAMLFS